MATRLIVVDDDVDFVPSLVEHLRSDGFTVRATGLWADVLPLVKEIDPEVALVDLNMPGIRGEDVVSVLKRFTRVRAFLYSSASDDELESARRRCGADGVVRKGRLRDLVALLRSIPGRVSAAP